MRHWINLVESLALPKGCYFHASEQDLPVGTVLEPRRLNMLDGDVEEALEGNRPARKLSRMNAVFMADDMRALESVTVWADANLYLVRPTAKPLKLDHAWANEVWRLFGKADVTGMTPSLQDGIKLHARGYWSGTEMHLVRSLDQRIYPAQWELLAPSATVVAKLR